MMTAKHFVAWLTLACCAAGSFVSCEQREASTSRRPPRAVETIFEGFAGLDELEAITRERLMRTASAPSTARTLTPMAARAKVVRDLAKEGAPPPEDQLPTRELAPDEASTAPPRIADVVRPAPITKTELGPAPARKPPRDEYTPAMNISLVVGALGVGLGSAAASGDGTRRENAFAIASLGIGIAGFTTAWLLYEIGAGTTKVSFRMGPTSVGFYGSF